MALVPTLRLTFLLLNVIDNILGSLILLEFFQFLSGRIPALLFGWSHYLNRQKREEFNAWMEGFHDSTAVSRAYENRELTV
jgi:hypothetical protein